MQTKAVIQTIEDKIRNLLSHDPEHFLVEVYIKPINNIKVYIDGDGGIPLSQLIRYNRRLYKMIEEDGLYPDGDICLEVSSPGLDEPLKIHRQYKKNIGRFVDILLNNSSKKEGKLLEATEDGIVIEWEEGKGKKKVTKKESIIISDIKNTKVQIKF